MFIKILFALLTVRRLTGLNSGNGLPYIFMISNSAEVFTDLCTLTRLVVPAGTVLKVAEIKNYDLRYEFYPSVGEYIQVGAFYKTFTNPIQTNHPCVGWWR